MAHTKHSTLPSSPSPRLKCRESRKKRRNKIARQNCCCCLHGFVYLLRYSVKRNKVNWYNTHAQRTHKPESVHRHPFRAPVWKKSTVQTTCYDVFTACRQGCGWRSATQQHGHSDWWLTGTSRWQRKQRRWREWVRDDRRERASRFTLLD